jgi:hypothetical protein
LAEKLMAQAGPYGIHARGDMSRYQEALHDMEERRTMARQAGRRFADEGRYQRLNAVRHQIEELGKAAAKAAGERQDQLRAQQNRLAALALR